MADQARAGDPLPETPTTTVDFERGVAWASRFFSIAECLDFGLDEGQQLILAGIVKRLNQLEMEALDG